MYNQDEFINRFRLPKEAILRLTDDLSNSLGPTTARSHSIPALLQVCTAVRFYATGSFLNTVGDTLGLSKASVSRVVHRVSSTLSDKLPKFPTQPAELNSIKRGFFNVARFPNVIGAIDGTHVRIQAPSDHEHLFVNRKGYHSLNIQAVCDSNLKFLNCVARWPGSCHDSRVLQNSQLYQAFEDGIIDGILLGDSGYPLKPWLLTPFLYPTTPAQRNYNAAHCSTRNTVERAFGVLKRRFHCLHASPASSESEQPEATHKADVPTKRRREKPVYLTDDQQQLLADWLKDHPEIYTKGSRDFKNTERKKRRWEDMAKDLGVSYEELIRWPCHPYKGDALRSPSWGMERMSS
ncbi:putative nuclease HARBI1 [Gadus chalcogrammus]|uniref:putative nuclease HARBI1 n=1 Tax=Gadus chalcogrammus TaxID=1042646 RepID=UPI0024C4967A|nr:putative nuclease HARBI1 [Gadus chalcogrammus]